MSTTRRKRMLRNLECEAEGHPWPEPVEILQIQHFYPGTNQIVKLTTPHGALDNLKCPECGSPPKDPNA